MSRTFVGWFALMLLTFQVQAGEVAEHLAPKKSRAPASVVPGLPGVTGWKDSFRVPMFTLPRKAESSTRWRLMGTCRNDIGMQQSVSGMGYGNCLKN